MKSDITKTALAKLDCRMNFENRKIILFFDKGTRHPEGLQNGLTNIKLVFLFKMQHPDYNLLIRYYQKF